MWRYHREVHQEPFEQPDGRNALVEARSLQVGRPTAALGELCRDDRSALYAERLALEQRLLDVEGRRLVHLEDAKLRKPRHAVRPRVHPGAEEHELSASLLVVLGKQVVAVARARNHDPPSHGLRTALASCELGAEPVGEESVRPLTLVPP